MYVVCMSHLEEALDDFVIEFEQSPDIYELDEIRFTDWKTPEKCDYCEEKPRFLVL